MGKNKHSRISFGDEKGPANRPNFGKNRGSRRCDDLNEDDEQTEIHFMQPELMENKAMIDLLTKRGGNIAILHNKDKKYIVTLFYKHISPKPQRIYRNNRVGKLFQSKIKKVTSCSDDWNVTIMSSGRKSLSSNRQPKTSDTSSLSTSSKKSSLDFHINDRRKISNSSDSLENIVIKKREPKTEVQVVQPAKSSIVSLPVSQPAKSSIVSLSGSKPANSSIISVSGSKPKIVINERSNRSVITIDSNGKSPVTKADNTEISADSKLVDRKKLNLMSPSLSFINKILVSESNGETDKRKSEEESGRPVKLQRVMPSLKNSADESSNKCAIEDSVSNFVKLARNSSFGSSSSIPDIPKKKRSIGWP